jgi:hypothetical protein
VGYLGARLVLVVWTPRGRGPAGDIDEVLQCQRKEALREQNPVR